MHSIAVCVGMAPGVPPIPCFPEEELLEEVEEPDADETANPANTTGKRKADQALESSAKRLARISTQPTFDFEEGCDEYR